MGLGVVAIADPPTAIRLKVPFSDGLGGGRWREGESDWESPTHGLSQSGTAALLGRNGERDLTGGVSHRTGSLRGRG